MNEAVWAVAATLLTVIGNGLVGIGLELAELARETYEAMRNRG